MMDMLVLLNMAKTTSGWLRKTSTRFAFKLFLKKFGYDLFLGGAPSGNISGTFREHSGNIQGTSREHSGNIQGGCAKSLRASLGSYSQASELPFKIALD
jgi:hypothetical protein